MTARAPGVFAQTGLTMETHQSGRTAPAGAGLLQPEDIERGDMAACFFAACDKYGARPAYKIDGRWISYADCAARVTGIAASLHDTLRDCVAGEQGQPVIAVLLPNSHCV